MCHKCEELVKEHDESMKALELDISIKVATLLGKSNPNMTMNDRIAASTFLSPYIMKWIVQMVNETADQAIQMSQNVVESGNTKINLN